MVVQTDEAMVVVMAAEKVDCLAVLMGIHLAGLKEIVLAVN